MVTRYVGEWQRGFVAWFCWWFVATWLVAAHDVVTAGWFLDGDVVVAISAGVVPTPAVAFLVRKFKALAGAVISASHNPFEDNGIKFFSASVSKLRDDQEAAIEAALQGEVEITEAAAETSAAMPRLPKPSMLTPITSMSS